MVVKHSKLGTVRPLFRRMGFSTRSLPEKLSTKWRVSFEWPIFRKSDDDDLSIDLSNVMSNDPSNVLSNVLLNDSPNVLSNDLSNDLSNVLQIDLSNDSPNDRNVLPNDLPDDLQIDLRFVFFQMLRCARIRDILYWVCTSRSVDRSTSHGHP